MLDLAEYGCPTINELEAAMLQGQRVEMPVTHHFTPGMYLREIFIPANTLLTSAIHKTEHPFFVMRGRIAVISENEGRVIYEAPHMGITLPGTRRVLHAETDTVWITCHATTETDVDKITAEILEPVTNPLLPAGFVPDFKEPFKIS